MNQTSTRSVKYPVRAKQLIRLIEELPYQEALTGAEIGVYLGATSASLLDRFENLKLWMVDPYNPGAYLKKNDQLSKLSAANHLDHASTARNAVEFASDRRTFVPVASPEAARFVPDDLDFVFLDGDHSYEAVTQDISTWIAKLKPDGNGLFAGHDYNRTEVAQAVDEFAAANGLSVHVGDHSVWWVK